jgi:hypothetical protein
VSVLRSERTRAQPNGNDLTVVSASLDLHEITQQEKTVHLRECTLAQQVPGLGEVHFTTLVVDDLLMGATQEQHRRVTQVLRADFIVRTGLRPGDGAYSSAIGLDERFNALRVGYRYARTCHRAQGGEWDRVVIDFAGAQIFGQRWAYTAVTRGRCGDWLVSAPQAKEPMRLRELRNEAERALERAGLRVRAVREIQSGVKLTVGDGDGTNQADVDLYLRGGRPSRVVGTGAAVGPLRDRVVNVLEKWIDEQKALDSPPVPDAIIELVAQIAPVADDEGLVVNAQSPHQNQVRFKLSDRSRDADITFYHDASGRLTKEVNAKGDTELLGRLRELLEEVTP